MDLVAGEAPTILMVIGLDDLEALDDRSRFTAHLALGSGLDPTWLDLFAEAAREERFGLHRRRDAPRGPGPMRTQLFGAVVGDRAVEVDVAPGVGVPAGEAADAA